MSYDLLVYLKRGNMPTPVVWHSSIVDAAFPVELDKDFDVDSFTGFLPCHVNGELSGFEYYAPTTRIEDIEKVEIVFKDGIGYDSAKLIESVRGVVGSR